MTMRPMTQRDVLIVIPCLNEERCIAAVLDRLLADAAAPRSLIVVADGGSQDMSAPIVSAYVARYPDQVALITNKARYQSAAVNLADAEYGEGCSWLVRIDAHARYPRDYVAGLIKAAEATDADSVVVPMRSTGEGCVQRAIAAAQNSVFGTGGSAHRHPGHSAWVDHGHHALFKRAAFNAVSGYNPSFSHNEDAELDQRLTVAGRRIWLAGDLAIEYFPRATFGALLKQYFAYGKGRARTAALHQMSLRARQRLPLLVAPAVLLAALTPLFPIAAAPLLVWLLGCVIASLIIAASERAICGLLAAPALAVMHAGWAFGFWRQLLTSKSEPAAVEDASLASSGSRHKSPHPARPEGEPSRLRVARPG